MVIQACPIAAMVSPFNAELVLVADVEREPIQQTGAGSVIEGGGEG